MRMWKVTPSLLCDRHLLGEHVEMHMFVGFISKGKRLGRFLTDGLVEVHNIRKRHDELAAEMLNRGFRHKSPIPQFNEFVSGKVDIAANLLDLRTRCAACRTRQKSK